MACGLPASTDSSQPSINSGPRLPVPLPACVRVQLATLARHCTNRTFFCIGHKATNFSTFPGGFADTSCYKGWDGRFF